MENGLLKRVLVIGMMLLFIGSFIASATSINLPSKQELMKNVEPVSITVQNNDDIIEINYQINSFTKIPVIINDVEYLRILLGDESNMLLKGMPDLPDVRRSVLIPDTAKMDVRVIASTFKEFKNILIAPSKGDLPRTIAPKEIPYTFDDMYNENKWFPENIAELEMPYILRDFRGQVVKINPFQYNPVEKTLRFYTEITVEIYSIGTDTINCITRTELPSKIDTDFKQIYSRHFLNFNTLERYDPVSEQGNMLVIAYDDFIETMTPFIEWKAFKGIPIEMVKVSEIGNANDIKTYIENYYNNTGLTFVLLVGDAAQVPTLYTSPYTSHASDPSYSYIVGDDNYQDLFVGRFSAQNIDQLITQVERSVEYEKYPQVGAEWYHKGTGVASNQGPGDDGEYDDEHMDNIRDDLLAYTYTEVDQIYDPYATSSLVATALNDGRSTVNYCGHGSPTSWGSSGFNNNDVNSLVNDNMLPFMSSVACNNGEFDNYDTCFAEAWLRATNNGEPTGAIGMFASTQSQSWDPPMDAQDEIIDILIETYEDHKRITYGALCFEGTMHMMDEYGSGCYSETDTWTVFGDPSLQVRTDVPTEMTVSHEPVLEEGYTSFDVTVTDIGGALCAISRDLVPLGCAYTDASGLATILFDEPISGPDPVDLVVTAYNKIPYEVEIPTLINYAPEAPTIGGSHWAIGGIEYEYTFMSTDPNEHDVTYSVTWGYSGDSYGPYPSGDTITVTHTWTKIGKFTIKAMAKDTLGAESDWSEFEVTVPIKGLPSQNVKIFNNILQSIAGRTTNS